MLLVEEELLNLVEPAREEAVDLLLRAQPSRGSRAGKGRRCSQGSGGTRAGHGPTPWQQLEDVLQVGLFRRR